MGRPVYIPKDIRYIEIKKGKVARTIDLHKLQNIDVNALIFLDVDKNNNLLGIELITCQKGRYVKQSRKKSL